MRGFKSSQYHSYQRITSFNIQLYHMKDGESKLYLSNFLDFLF